MPGSLWRRLIALVNRRRLLDELDEELQTHFEDLRQALQDEGHAPHEAVRLARLRLGGVSQLRERARDEWRLGALEGASDDLRLAWRSLARRPAFVAATTATLGLGIGASTAIFSIAWGVALRPLPYAEPERLVRIYESNPANGEPEHDVSNPAFHEWRVGARSIESAAMYSKVRRRFLAGADQHPVTTMAVSPAFFDLLGTRPRLGQGFKPEHAYTRFTMADVVLSFGAWQRLFAADPDVIGRQIHFAADDDPWRVVGVMPEGFAFHEPVDVWQPQIVELPLAPLIRNWRYERVVARLRPGSTVEQAQAELETVAARLAREFPTIHGGWTVTVRSLRASIVGGFARAAWLLVAAAALVLLVACVNVGGLLAARAGARARESAIRVALGAGSWRLVRLWLAEACVLAALGVGAGLLLARGSMAVLAAAAPPGIPRLEEIRMDVPVLLAALAAGVAALGIFALAPLRIPARPLLERLRAESSGAGQAPARLRAQWWLAIAQFAGAAALVVLALMLTRSFVRLMAVDPGWNADGVLSLTVSPPMPSELRRPWYRFLQWSDELIERLEATPGIERAAITTEVPLGQDAYPSTLARGRGKAAGDSGRWPAVEHLVTDGYFDLLDLSLLDGRTFAREDRFTEAQLNWIRDTERGVAVVSEATARLLWPGERAVGQSLWLPDGDNVRWREVVGVVEDMQFHSLEGAPGLHVFVPWTQHVSGRPRLLVKAAGSASSFVPLVRHVVTEVQAGTTIDQVLPLDELVWKATARPRFTSQLVASFGGLALVLAAVGIYGTLSFLVGAREREIGIRIALGASRQRMVATVLRQGLGPALAGALLGSVLALAIARSFEALLFQLEPLDVSPFAAAIALLLTVAALASAGPARRASRIDPMRALRTD